ncbi:MAG: response regulator [Butyrivibrio sp.]|nr:response regulator [Butyrivibrio sp.]
MGDVSNKNNKFEDRLTFEEPELCECELTDEKVSQMSGEEKTAYITENLRKLRIIFESDPKRINYANEIIKLARSMNNIEYEGVGYFHMAIFFNASHKYYYRFRETMQQSIELLKNTKMYPALSSGYTLLGVDANNYGQFNLNMDYFLLARHYANLQNDPYIIALVHYYFSGFYIMVNDIDTALEYGLKSVEYYEKNEDRNSDNDYFGSDGMDMAYCMLGQCYIFMGRFDKAIECYNKSIEREKKYEPRYDCPNTALIYAFHVMALHVSFKIEERDKAVNEFIDIIKMHNPSPPFFMHIVNLTFFLLKIGAYSQAAQINEIMIKSEIAKDNPNFGVYISNIQIIIAKKNNDDEATFKAMQKYFDYQSKNNALVLENLRRAAELRIDMDDIQEQKNELKIARAANEAKSNFLSNVSHEIRTPLNAILGMDEIIMRETDDDAIYNYANDIKSAGNTLLGLINDILDSSKLDAGKINIITVEYDISSAINDLVNMISQRAQNKGLELKVEVDESIPILLYGDEIRVKQCVLNILTNAVKYTEKGSVTLRVSSRKAKPDEIEKVSEITYTNADGEVLTLKEDRWCLKGYEPIMLKFSIIDTGIGIKEQDLNKLTIPFERIEEERNRNIEGTGLGMSIVRRLLDMMGSTLNVESVYGEGSTFSFEVIQGVRSGEKLGNYTERYKKNLGKRNTYKIKFTAPDARMLIVDDTPANLTVAKGLLKPVLAKIDTAESGREALEMVKTNKYDILFIDHRMPEMDGVETLHAFEEQSENLSKGAPCIVLTANAISGAREMFLSEGFDDYITKPIDSVKLINLVRNYLPEELKHELEQNLDEESVNDKNNSANRKRTDRNLNDDITADLSDVHKIELLSSIPDMDVNSALLSCGNDLEILLSTIGDFVNSAKIQPVKIEEYQKNGEIKNYTIQVHGLKSAARFVGAISLSEKAAFLEKCGDEENIDLINKETQGLLDDFRKMADNMKKVLDELDNEEREKDTSFNEDNLKPIVDEATLQGIYEGVKEFVSAYDFKSAEGIINMLKDFSLKDEDKEKIEKMKEMIRNVDHDGLLDYMK